VRTLTLDRTFEVVFTSYGTVYWLPALAEWAETVAAHLEPGGVFYMADSHPFAAPFGHESTADDLRLAGPYFNEGARTFEHDGSYAGWNFGLDSERKHGFSHPPGEIVTALVEAGLRVEFWHDHPWSFFQRFDAMGERDGRWYLPELEYDLPFTFSLRARLPA
jgi:SAM-dependent methyltransferase